MKKEKLKIAIITGKRGEHIEDLISEIESQGHQAIHIHLKNLVLVSLTNKFDVLKNGKSILDFDIFILRNAFRSLKNEMCIIANYLLENDKVVVDEILGEKYIAGKMYESSLLVRAGIPVPKTIQIFKDNNIESVLQSLEFPLVAKPIVGSQGRGVKKINNLEELTKIKILDDSDKYLFQEYIPIESDIRVFVVGNKAIGAIKRFIQKDDFRTNASLGSKVEEIKLTDELANLAVRASNAVGYEIAGVDVIVHQEKKYVLEVNNAPQWLAFKKITGINPAEEIVKYVVAKYKKVC